MLKDIAVGIPLGAGSVLLMYLVASYVAPLIH